MTDDKINITVIHSSDIVLAGLSDIVENCCDLSVFKAKSIHDLPDYPNIMGCHLIILPKKYYTQNIALLNRVFVNAQAVRYLYIENDNTENSMQTISIEDSIADICLKISDMLKLFEQQHNEAPQHSLSERETDVLELIVKGLKNKEIADILFISTHTVITHRKNITEKLNIKSISGLTVYAALKKIINLDEINLNELI